VPKFLKYSKERGGRGKKKGLMGEEKGRKGEGMKKGQPDGTVPPGSLSYSSRFIAVGLVDGGEGRKKKKKSTQIKREG